MSLQGSLKDIAVADLIQHHCVEKKTVWLQIQRAGKSAEVFIKEGNVVHAALDQMQGEEVIYEILGWDEGTFYIESDILPPLTTVYRNWTALLLEGARRLDEQNLLTTHEEKSGMAKMDEILKQMSEEINGFVDAQVIGMDGLNIAQYSRAKVNLELIAAQLTLLMKLLDTAVKKSEADILEDNLLTTQTHYVMMRFLPGKQHYLAVVTDRKSANLGNLRLVTGVYLERLNASMPK